MQLADMPAKLRSYALTVAVGGPLLALAIAVSGMEALSGADLLRAVLLTVVTAAAYGNPLRVTHKFTSERS